MKSTLLTVFVLFCQLLYAQKDQLGFRGGISWSGVKTDTPFENSNATSGFLGGVTYQHQFESGFYFGIEVLYSERGFEDDLFPGSLDPCINCLRIAEPAVHQFNYNYLSVPIKAGFSFGEQVTFFADLALVPAGLLQARVHSLVTDEEIPGVDSFDLATQIEVGALFRLYDRWAAFGALSYLHSLTSLTNDNYFPGDRMLHRNANLSFGVRYEIKKG